MNFFILKFYRYYTKYSQITNMTNRVFLVHKRTRRNTLSFYFYSARSLSTSLLLAINLVIASGANGWFAIAARS